MQLTTIAKSELVDLNYNDTGVILKPGDQVEYHGHLVGGNVKVRMAGRDFIAHPGCFKELR